MSDTDSDTNDFRQPNGRFTKGNPGGPGRPRNPVSAAAVDLDRAGSEVAQELMQITIERARKGNLRAAEMVLQRVWPVRRNRPLELEPPAGDGYGVFAEYAALAQAMMNGDISPQDAQTATRVFRALDQEKRRVDHMKWVAERDKNRGWR